MAVYTECTLACYYAICIHDYFHIRIRLVECEVNEMKKEKGHTLDSPSINCEWVRSVSFTLVRGCTRNRSR